MKKINVPEPIPIVVGLTGIESLTAKMVADVKSRREKNTALYDNIFEEINNLTLESVKAIESYDLVKLGEYMNLCQGLLNAIQVSSPELEEIIAIARKNGTLGAKLTGAGGGGAAIALCPGNADKVSLAIKKAGYHTVVTHIG
jgi:hydroxymethylglutaryl-CoA reductase